MNHLQTVARWVFMLAIEFIVILAIIKGLNALNPGLVQSIAALTKNSTALLVTVVLGTIAVRTLVTTIRNRIFLRNAGDRAAMQAWIRSRRS